MAGIESMIEELVAWANQHGTKLDPRVEIYNDQITGLSFRAHEDIPTGTSIAVSSPATSISYLNATESLGYSRHGHSFPTGFITGLEGFYCHVIGHFFLVQQYLMGKESFWYPYIRTLPQPGSPGAVSNPLSWTKEDRKFLTDTNAGKAIEEKLVMLESDYLRGLPLLVEMPNAGLYTWDLYLWAAIIFGTRSFRASLTTSTDVLKASLLAPRSLGNSENDKALEYVQGDDFSILHPLVDIGNHNGENHVRWLVNDVNQFNLTTTIPITKGEQIYNFYGPKTNSELLVGYGFILDNQNSDKDVVYVSLLPPADARTLRRSQTCHASRKNSKVEEEWKFKVFSAPEPFGDGRLGYRHFEHGLVESISCIVANDRERRSLRANPEYCLEKDPELNSFNMSRNIIASYQVLHEKLQIDLEKLRMSSTDLVAKTHNQRLALEYRQRQIETLEKAALPYTLIFRGLLQHNTFCSHGHHSRARRSDNPRVVELLSSVEILPLDCAYDWLSKAFPDIYVPLSFLVSGIEDEPLPIRWNVLAEEFGVIYWTIWIFIVLTLHADDSTVLAPYPDLRKWMGMISSSVTKEKSGKSENVLTYGRSFVEKLDENDSFGPLVLDQQERETIIEIVNVIVHYPELRCRHERSLEPVSIRTLAACVAFQETIVLPLNDDRVDTNGSNTEREPIASLSTVTDIEGKDGLKEVAIQNKPRTHLVLCIPKDAFEVYSDSDDEMEPC